MGVCIKDWQAIVGSDKFVRGIGVCVFFFFEKSSSIIANDVIK